MKKEGMRATLFMTRKASVQKLSFQVNPMFFFLLITLKAVCEHIYIHTCIYIHIIYYIIYMYINFRINLLWKNLKACVSPQGNVQGEPRYIYIYIYIHIYIY